MQTPDHPLSYAGFEGRIREGDPGAGTVEIWDDGSYVLHSWAEDKIVVTLRGRVDGGLGGKPRTFALIRTEMDGNPDNWLMHRTADSR